ncbi:tetratricopeptide repeat protein 29 isoform X2 [Girardinichthys multiradiatus]|uniref:tetratricopeptide repeat protein 29 isoform X2 n=1 Tax=Girardinichthys multiradiatus TaxID=208333 RepID=UPI001FAC9FBD|nr:tetratricopeptide repeat protein 29 isoform X2 [Girardinichthys multiradiatus]XP_047242319.1 tetratricopeptide repeat protein 29 isoform X2 [Girardinichthys multiradiatus]XP_047242320.1 tetratricopeptide repeat protein 29 isoform X2 [Girardinichthys multiradiatus]
MTAKSSRKTNLMKQSVKSFNNKRVLDLSILSKKEIALFRNSPKQYVCVEMLQDGYHRAFSEVFSLLRSDRDQRSEELPGSSRLQTPPLEEQREKLETLRLHLSRAEKAEREGSWTAVCEERLHLGRYFAHHEDFWLSFHFYHSCADREFGGRSKPATEARLHLADLYQQKGDLEEARQQAEMGLKQAEEGGWVDLDGRPLRLKACTELGKIYSLQGEVFLAAKDYDKAKKLFHQGSKMATEGEDKSVEGEAVFRQGLSLHSSEDHHAARKVFSTCIEIFSELQDVKGLVKTYKAIAKSLESEGNMEETLQVLEKSVDICRSSDQQGKLADICLYLGSIYRDLGQPLEACKYLLQGYKAACSAGDVTLLQKAQVKLGRTCALSLIRKYSSDMESSSLTSVKRLVAWKETRGHQDFCSDVADLNLAAFMGQTVSSCLLEEGEGKSQH